MINFAILEYGIIRPWHTRCAIRLFMHTRICLFSRVDIASPNTLNCKKSSSLNNIYTHIYTKKSSNSHRIWHVVWRVFSARSFFLQFFEFFWFFNKNVRLKNRKFRSNRGRKNAGILANQFRRIQSERERHASQQWAIHSDNHRNFDTNFRHRLAMVGGEKQ